MNIGNIYVFWDEKTFFFFKLTFFSKFSAHFVAPNENFMIFQNSPVGKSISNWGQNFAKNWNFHKIFVFFMKNCVFPRQYTWNIPKFFFNDFPAISGYNLTFRTSSIVKNNKKHPNLDQILQKIVFFKKFS